MDVAMDLDGQGSRDHLQAVAGDVPGAVPALASQPLTLLQRILLTTDGTVGRILQQFTGEEMRVIKLEQSLNKATPGHPALEATEHDTVLRRTVLLQGRLSGANFMHAESLLRTASIGEDLLEALVDTDVPMGRLFCDRRLETFREVLTSGQEPAGSCADHFAVAPSSALIYRTYRIWHKGTPMVVITEKFPVAGLLSSADATEQTGFQPARPA
jgi:chorismate-pyruvate lyase